MALTEEKLLTVLLNLSCHKGWITEYEKLRITTTTRTLNDRKMVVLDLMNTMDCDDNAARLLLSMRCIHDMNTPELAKGDENRFLPKIMSKLFEKRLVTKEEMAEFLPPEKKVDNQENCADVKFEDNIDETQKYVNGTVKNPLQINVVIKCVVQYLNFQEIKECRLISKEWASVGLNGLISRSKIIFDNSERDEIYQRRGPLQFFQLFPERSENNRTFPFSNVVIDSYHQDPWPVEELNYFFRNQGQYITDLALSDLYLMDDDWKNIYSLDITPWICNSPMAMPNSNTNTKLSIVRCWKKDFWSGGGAKLSLNLIAFSNVKDLELRGCRVNLQGGIQIRPIILRMEYLTFSMDGSPLTELRINDFVDFSKAKNVSLDSSRHSKVVTKLSLDLSGCHRMECLSLSKIELINWKTSNWKIDQLLLDGVPLTVGTTQMQIKKLDFEDSQIDVSLLPQSLEELVIDGCDPETFTASQPIVLHNLKCLKMRLPSICFSTFFENVKCPNLILLESGEDDVEMDLAWFASTNVKILSLCGITCKNEENRMLNIDKLVLREYPFSEVIEVCRNIQAKVVVLYFPWTETERVFYWEFVKLLKNQKSAQDLGQSIYVGVDESYFLPKVDGPVDDDDGNKYYLFENNLGKGISRDEFEKNVNNGLEF